MGIEIMDNIESIDIGGDFKLDDILEEKDNTQNENCYRAPIKKATGSEIAESKKLLKKIGNRMTEEEIKKKTELIIQISRFRDSSRFASFLTSLGFNLAPTHLKSLDISELEDLLIELKNSIQNKNGSKVLDEGYFMVLGMLETVSKHPRFNQYCDLQGLSSNARQSDELLDTLECLNLMYCDLGSLSPEKKLLFLTGGLILRTSSVNKMLNNIKKYEEALKNQVDEKNNGMSNTVVSSEINVPIQSSGHNFNIIPDKQMTKTTMMDSVINKNMPIVKESIINFDFENK